MTQKTKHAPTPWKFLEPTGGYEVLTGEGDEVFHNFDYDRKAPSRDNAAYIVRACNNMAKFEGDRPMDDLIAILGRPNFACAGIASALRVLGREIPHKAEREQAAAIFWMLQMLFVYGDKWEMEAVAVLKHAAEIPKARGEA